MDLANRITSLLAHDPHAQPPFVTAQPDTAAIPRCGLLANPPLLRPTAAPTASPSSRPAAC